MILVTITELCFAASGLPNPNSQWEGEVEFLQDSRPADGVYTHFMSLLETHKPLDL